MEKATAVLKPRISKRSKACSQCRSTKKKCDKQRPICSQCQRSGSCCRWREPTLKNAAQIQRISISHFRPILPKWSSNNKISDMSSKAIPNVITSSSTLNYQFDEYHQGYAIDDKALTPKGDLSQEYLLIYSRRTFTRTRP